MNQDTEILRRLASQLAEIAHLPVQDEKKTMWRTNNDLKPVRPMVHIDQLPWHELATAPEMQLACQDPYLRTVEQRIREKLYRWQHFPCDMVVEARIDLTHEISGLFYGAHIKESTLATDSGNDIVSHDYQEQLDSEEAVASLAFDQVVVDRALDAAHLQQCQQIFEGILPVRFEGVQIHTGIWDRIAMLRKVDNIIYDLIDRPELTEQMVLKMVDITMDTVDQCERLNLLDENLEYVHCTGAYTDDLAKPAGGQVLSRNVWAFGMSQILSTVSPAMHEEFDIALIKPLYERFGLMYYGCCEPLHNKIDMIRKIKNVRKISISPWADIDISADRIAGDYVFSCKANPAYIANEVFEEAAIRRQLERAAEACKRNGTPIEFILKDVSTVRYHLDMIDRWEKLAMEVAQKYS